MLLTKKVIKFKTATTMLKLAMIRPPVFKSKQIKNFSTRNMTEGFENLDSFVL